MNIFDNIAANLSLKYENSEFYKNKLIKRYKPLITPGVKSQNELIIFEEHNNFFISNSQIVEMLLIIKEGVSAEDYENETPEFLNYIRVCRYFCQTNFFKLNKAVTYDEFDMIDISEDESDSDDSDYFDESEDEADDFTDAIEF